MTELCRECVEAIWPHWNRCEEGQCVVADTYDAAAQNDHADPRLAALEAMAALREGDHGYCAHVVAHSQAERPFVVVTEHEDLPVERFAPAQLPLFDSGIDIQTSADGDEYADIGL